MPFPLSVSCFALFVSLPAFGEEGVSLFNGRDFAGWRLLTRKAEVGLGEKVFSIAEGGVIHVYRDFEDGYQLDTGENDTHAIRVTEKSYRNYRFSWDCKWGAKKLNNFAKYQYDAGMFYHVQQAKVWPQGFEYQIRYDHRSDQNHTGDVWNCGVAFRWSKGPNERWLPVEQGGEATARGGGEHLASADAKAHTLDGAWNHCEVIVMGKDFAIHKLNGKIVNVMTDHAHDSGPIALQAETAEVFYRNLRIKEFTEAKPLSDFWPAKNNGK